MILSLNTNSLSSLVQNSLASSTAGLNTAIERLTTGYKINHAKDNAAGYSIATQYSSKLSSYSVAQDNTAMGLDLLTTASDSLSLITSHLQRMRDLAEQAANGTYGKDSLQAIQAEFNQRTAEIDRLMSTTEYNGVKLFKESGSNFIHDVESLSYDEAVAQGYTIISSADDFQKMRDDLDGKFILMSDIDLSGEVWECIGDLNNPFTGEFNGNGYTISNLLFDDGTQNYSGFFGRVYGADISNVGFENANVTGMMYTGILAGYNYSSSVYNCYVTGVVEGLNDTGALIGYNTNDASIDSCYSMADVTGSGYRIGGLVGFNTVRSAIDYSFAQTDVSGNLNVGGLVGQNTSATVTNSFSEGKVSGNSQAGGFTGFNENGTINSCYWNTESSQMNTGIAQGTASGVTGSTAAEIEELKINNLLPGYNILLQEEDTEIEFQVGIHSDDSSRITIDTEFNMRLSALNVSTSEAARKALAKLDNMLSIVSAKQTEYGAAYNRLESALDTIGVSIDNLTSSRSTLQDADIAEVSSDYIKNQILQRASATLLATANQTPSIALQLL